MQCKLLTLSVRLGINLEHYIFYATLRRGGSRGSLVVTFVTIRLPTSEVQTPTRAEV